jgi:hypothetical protein
MGFALCENLSVMEGNPKEENKFVVLGYWNPDQAEFLEIK